MHRDIENISYYETLRKNVKIFEKTIQGKIENLEFKINIPNNSRYREVIILMSNVLNTFFVELYDPHGITIVYK